MSPLLSRLTQLGPAAGEGEPLPVIELVLRSARLYAGARGRSLPLAVVGERAPLLNLSGLPNSANRRIADAPVEPGHPLLGPALTLMQQQCDKRRTCRDYLLLLRL